MFKWLKDKAEKAAASTSLLNVTINTKTLASIANQADSRIQQFGEMHAPDIEKVTKAQISLLTDIQLCLANGLTMNAVQAAIAEALASEYVSSGAKMAIEHVIKSALEQNT